MKNQKTPPMLGHDFGRVPADSDGLAAPKVATPAPLPVNHRTDFDQLAQDILGMPDEDDDEDDDDDYEGPI